MLQSWEDADGLLNYLSTVPTDGGWAKIQWNSSKVAIIDSLAQTGYTPKVRQVSPTRVVISFESAGRSTTIEAWWEEDEPKIDVDNGDD